MIYYIFFPFSALGIYAHSVEELMLSVEKLLRLMIYFLNKPRLSKQKYLTNKNVINFTSIGEQAKIKRSAWFATHRLAFRDLLEQILYYSY